MAAGPQNAAASDVNGGNCVTDGQVLSGIEFHMGIIGPAMGCGKAPIRL